MTFLEALAMHRDGKLVAALTDELKDVIASAVDTGKKASLTLKLSFEPNGERGMTMTPDIKVSLAKQGVGGAVFYADAGGELHRRDPMQHDVEDHIARSANKPNLEN